MQELVESPGATAANAYVQWGPVIAGALVGTAVASVLMAFAAALGLLAASPSPSWRKHIRLDRPTLNDHARAGSRAMIDSTRQRLSLRGPAP
jgi:hypothetical protein